MVDSHLARYIMVGGFLGAGKTTALLRLAEYYQATGASVWIITNDQGESLVDTQRVKAAGVSASEITGGCFCCRFNELLALASSIRAEHRPDVILAEPVGSCTDLRATVHYPLRLMYGRDYRIMPLTTLVDALQLEAYFGIGNPEFRFDAAVQYIFQTQLEEASLIVVNKIEMLSAERRQRLDSHVSQRFPKARVIMASMYTGEGFDEWTGVLADEDKVPAGSPPVDYRIYAEGEAALGWLNAVVTASSDVPFSSADLLQSLSRGIADEVKRAGGKIAHLKMSVSSPESPTELTAVSLVSTTSFPVLTASRAGNITSGMLVVNIRVEADPELIRKSLLDAISQTEDVRLLVKHLDAFRPGKPMPVYRIPNIDTSSAGYAGVPNGERRGE